jgi:hypothetical protein
VSIYSTQLFAGAIQVGTHVIYTPPATEIAVVRDAELYGDFSTAEQVALAVGVSGSPVAYFFFVNPLEPGKWEQWQGRVVIPAGGQLLSVSGGAGPTLVVSGYQFSS